MGTALTIALTLARLLWTLSLVAAPAMAARQLARRRIGAGGFLLRLAVMAVPFAGPFVSMAWSAAARNRPPRGLSEPARERWTAERQVSRLREDLERRDARVRRLVDRGAPAWMVGRAGRALEAVRAEVRDQSLVLGSLRRRDERRGDADVRTVPVRMTLAPDGRPRYGIPYDLTARQYSEVRMALARACGLDLGDEAHLGVSDHLVRDFGAHGAGVTTLVLDTSTGGLSTMGEPLPEGVRGVVRLCMESLDAAVAERTGMPRSPAPAEGTESAAELEAMGGGPETALEAEAAREAGKAPSPGGDGALPGGPSGTREPLLRKPSGRAGALSLEVLSPDTVAVTYGGACLAYAVAGKDGALRQCGTGADLAALDPKRSGEALRLASRVAGRLSGCGTLPEWVNAAASMVNSATNVEAASRRALRDLSLECRGRERKAAALSILRAPAHEMRRLGRGVSR